MFWNGRTARQGETRLGPAAARVSADAVLNGIDPNGLGDVLEGRRAEIAHGKIQSART
jgi:hypothetical protein